MLSFPNDSLRGVYHRITTRMILFVASGVILVNKEFRHFSVPKNRISLNLWKHFQHVYSSMGLKVESKVVFSGLMSLLRFHLINKWYFKYLSNTPKDGTDKIRINNTVLDRLEILILSNMLYVHHTCFEHHKISYFVFLQKIQKYLRLIECLLSWMKMYPNIHQLTWD